MTLVPAAAAGMPLSYHRDEMMPLGMMLAGGYREDVNESWTALKFKMAAIDLDGTLLGPDGTISPDNRDAVQHLHRLRFSLRAVRPKCNCSANLRKERTS